MYPAQLGFANLPGMSNRRMVKPYQCYYYERRVVPEPLPHQLHFFRREQFNPQVGKLRNGRCPGQAIFKIGRLF